MRQIHSTVPVLASLNLDESAAFYIDRLGFQKQLLVENYLIVSRESAEIHFVPCADRYIAENTSCYVRVDSTQQLYDEFSARGLQLKPPVVREWGMKELYVIDPHGNLMKFGESV